MGAGLSLLGEGDLEASKRAQSLSATVEVLEFKRTVLNGLRSDHPPILQHQTKSMVVTRTRLSGQVRTTRQFFVNEPDSIEASEHFAALDA